MRARVFAHGAAVVAVLAVVMAVVMANEACSKPAADPLQLDGGLLTVDNRTGQDWTDVEIWLNRSYRATAPSIPAHTRLQAPLSGFVAGFGQRFDFKRTQIRDVRLTAKVPNGEPIELKKNFTESGLAGAVRGKR